MLDKLGKALGALIPGVDSGIDAMQTALLDAASERLAPIATALIGQVREKLLESVTPEPPATYGDELRKVGLNVSAEQAKALWGAAFAAVANERRPQLRAIDGGAS